MFDHTPFFAPSSLPSSSLSPLVSPLPQLWVFPPQLPSFEPTEQKSWGLFHHIHTFLCLKSGTSYQFLLLLLSPPLLYLSPALGTLPCSFLHGWMKHKKESDRQSWWGTETAVKGQIKGSLWSSVAFSSDLMVLWYKFVCVARICIQDGARITPTDFAENHL